ncbi:BRCT domain-containing protein [Corynebacterium sp. HS2168-gen11]|uniref:BRCT domain-containing protein n=1 Tax=Corynebacterium sp. HS2168-gen11 TaxID=2974027 RepID=UPI00216B0D67|nr:BRCT domain-containing protein [Corynebacterium sp. HS2168-gen11]MCS4535571.1 DNA polymerase III subunit epsilon [Corynebacterium sp. HS2168-gen11]
MPVIEVLSSTSDVHPPAMHPSYAATHNAHASGTTRRRRRKQRPNQHPRNLVTLTPEELAAQEQQRAQRAEQRAAEIAAYPYVVVTIKATGIHPSTARLVVVDAVLFAENGSSGDSFHAVLQSGTDVGPQHLHGVTPEDIAEAKRFPQILKALGRFIDGRTLIVHNTPVVWGFLHAEARRAMANAARANRTRNRQRSQRRRRVGRIPVPAEIADTLASARRELQDIADTRVASVAHALGLHDADAHATVARARMPELSTTREETHLTAKIFFHTRSQGTLVTRTPENLTADRFGLQRTQIRVQAATQICRYSNPGVYRKGGDLVQGMEVVVAPEIMLDPDLIIAAAVEHGLSYSEKVTRQTSVVVCNTTNTQLLGKAMHASRKGVPLISDEEFLALVARTQPGAPLGREYRRH